MMTAAADGSRSSSAPAPAGVERPPFVSIPLDAILDGDDPAAAASGRSADRR